MKVFSFTLLPKRIIKGITLSLYIITFPCAAQQSPPYGSCISSAHTQVQMNACAEEEGKQAEAALNATYKAVLAAAADEPVSVAKIKAAERAWITYRDAYMNAMYPAKDKQAEYGSLYPMESSLIRAKLTRGQVAALNDLLRQYEPER